MKRSKILDEEMLFRRVAVHKPKTDANNRRYEKNDSGEFKVLPLAFYHNENRVSVNRQYDHNIVLKTQGDLSNGVVRLIAGYVRNMPDIYPFQAVVNHDPIDENELHSVITMETDKQITDDNHAEFRRIFRQNLADIANVLKWEIKPAY